MTSTKDFDNAEITQQYSHINTRFDLPDEALDNDNSSARLFERSRIKALAGERMHSKQTVSSLRRSCDRFLRWQCFFRSAWRAERMSYNRCLFIFGGFECAWMCHWPSLRFSEKNKIKNLTAGDPLFYSKAHSWSCAGVVCMFLVVSHPSSSWAVTPLHPLQVTGISCRFPECPPSDRSGQLPCLSVSHSTDLWHFWLSW